MSKSHTHNMLYTTLILWFQIRSRDPSPRTNISRETESRKSEKKKLFIFFLFKFKQAILMIYVEKWQRRDLLVKIILFCDISMPNCSVMAIRNESRFVNAKLNGDAESSCVCVGVCCLRIYALACIKCIID